MSSDALYNSCIDETIKLYWQTQAPVYQYVFDYKGSNSMVNLLVNSETPTVFPTGVCHGDELFLLFNLRIIGLRDPSPYDNRVSDRMTTLWTDFAKNGYSPKIENYEYPRWPKWDPETMMHYRISGDLRLEREPYRQFESFLWSHRLRNISGLSSNGSAYPWVTDNPHLASLVSNNRPVYQTLAWAMVVVSVSLFLLIIILLVLLYFQKRSQSFRAETPVSTSHLPASSNFTLY